MSCTDDNSTEIRLTSQQLRELAEKIDMNEKYSNGAGKVAVSIKSHPSGRKYLEFEQPCCYKECFSTFYRYEEEEQCSK